MEREVVTVSAVLRHNNGYMYVINTSYVYNYIHTHVRRPFFETSCVSQYQKGKTNLDFTKARDSEWQWHRLGHMQVCTPLQTDNHASTPQLSFLQARCPCCHLTNSVKALKAVYNNTNIPYNVYFCPVIWFKLQRLSSLVFHVAAMYVSFDWCLPCLDIVVIFHVGSGAL